MRMAVELYDAEVLRAELRNELRTLREMQNDLRRKIAAIDTSQSAYLLSKVATLQAEVNVLKDRQRRRDEASERMWRKPVGETA